MENLRNITEDEPKIREFVSRAQADKINFENDERRKVSNTSQYPYLAIAHISMWYFGNPSRYSGTGFLADQHIFITCAHNVMDDMKSPNPARSVHIRFGVDGDRDQPDIKTLKLEGKDFNVPEMYRKGMDPSDIAWIDLKLYHKKKLDQDIALDWAMTDLPQTSFFTRKITEAHGIIKGNFLICGNKQSLILAIIKNRTLRNSTFFWDIIRRQKSLYSIS